MNKFKQFIYSKRFVIGIIAVFQMITFVWMVTQLYTVGTITYILLVAFSIFIMLYMIEKDNMN